jgi:hypothetical protein
MDDRQHGKKIQMPTAPRTALKHKSSFEQQKPLEPKSLLDF